MNTRTTDWITEKHPIVKYIFIVDSNDNIIGRIKEYNIETKEAVLYKLGGGVENKILEGSKLKVKDMSKYEIGADGLWCIKEERGAPLKPIKDDDAIGI